MGFRERLGRFRRRVRKLDAAERELFGVDPYGPPPSGLSYDVAVSKPGDYPRPHMHYGVLTETTGNWPHLSFTAWHDCRVCGRLS